MCYCNVCVWISHRWCIITPQLAHLWRFSMSVYIMLALCWVTQSAGITRSVNKMDAWKPMFPFKSNKLNFPCKYIIVELTTNRGQNKRWQILASLCKLALIHSCTCVCTIFQATNFEQTLQLLMFIFHLSTVFRLVLWTPYRFERQLLLRFIVVDINFVLPFVWFEGTTWSKTRDM